MRINITGFLILCLLPLNATIGQSIELKIKLIDEISKEPVPDAHLFMENTTFGNVSDKNGLVHLTIPQNIKEDLFVSHVAYQTKIIKHSYFKKNLEETIIELTPNAFEIEALTISAKRSKKRNKQFKILRKAFLGNDNISKNCTILNPEVIRFKEEKNKLIATATDLIIIDNPHLAYEIFYLLNMLEVSSDGSSKYLGQALFVDKSTNENQEEILRHRMETYFKSPKYFFKSLIDNKLQERGFEAELMSYEEGRFHPFKTFSRDSLLNGPSSHGKYTLEFDEFLKIYNKNSRIVSFDPRGVRQGGLESQRFSTATRDRKEVVSYDFSYIYKISPYVILNEFGNVLNSSDIKEYGSWASQKVAHQLPFDFGNSYEESSMNEGLTRPDNNQLSSQEKFTMIRSLLYERDPVKRNITFEKLSNYWEDGFAAPLIEIIRLSTDQELLQKINEILWDKFEHENQEDYYDWIQWLWTKNLPEEDYYYDIKSELYKHLDPLFESYFRERHDQSSINLGEVLWGGVRQDGIPPLRNPEMIEAAKADYLDDKDIVFGAYINGVAKAYPKRILGWHEFFTDNFKENKIAGVYCTLCGTVILYDMTYNGIFHDLGTSGFLYRSNKLMYDKSTQSLWSTIDGSPVIGPLTNQEITLNIYPVVTTNWKSWRQLHPDTQVLSENTGYARDYSEGVAYKEYYAKDDLMFPVPRSDQRLRNKDEVLVIRTDRFREDPLAISIKYLEKKKWHQDKLNNQSFVAIADKSSAARVYETNDIIFKEFRNGLLIDQSGSKWSLHEEYLSEPGGKILKRLPAHNIFWFAWYNAFPDTRLVH